MVPDALKAQTTSPEPSAALEQLELPTVPVTPKVKGLLGPVERTVTVSNAGDANAPALTSTDAADSMPYHLRLRIGLRHAVGRRSAGRIRGANADNRWQR